MIVSIFNEDTSYSLESVQSVDNVDFEYDVHWWICLIFSSVFFNCYTIYVIGTM
jgi:hypothetical protein